MRAEVEPLDFLARFDIHRIEYLPAARVNSVLSWLELKARNQFND